MKLGARKRGSGPNPDRRLVNPGRGGHGPGTVNPAGIIRGSGGQRAVNSSGDAPASFNTVNRANRIEPAPMTHPAESAPVMHGITSSPVSSGPFAISDPASAFTKPGPGGPGRPGQVFIGRIPPPTNTRPGGTPPVQATTPGGDLLRPPSGSITATRVTPGMTTAAGSGYKQPTKEMLDVGFRGSTGGIASSPTPKRRY